MGGLSQLELDALCSHEESDTEPSSPLGSILLIRKRSRQSPNQSQPVVPEIRLLSDEHAGDSEGGLSQAELDSLVVDEESTKDPYVGSPIGSALRSIKNRRRLNRPIEEELLVPPAAQQEEQATLIPPPCPASWGGYASVGLSQAELDAMGEEQSTTDEVPLSPSARQPGSQQRRRRGRISGCLGSPTRQSRAHKVDAENLGGKEALSVSPAKTMESVSPGSPMRRHFGASPLGRSPLSATLLN